MSKIAPLPGKFRKVKKLSFFIQFTLLYGYYTRAVSYTYTSSSGYYAAITGGTVLYSGTFDDAVSAAITIPAFKFNCTSYTTIYISTNGFITFGSAPTSTNYLPISSTGAYVGCVSAFGVDLTNSSTGSPEIRYEDKTASSEFVIQWKDVKRYAVDPEIISFQIRLNYNTDQITFVYGGTISPGNNNTFPQVGIRGSSNEDYYNLSTTNSWTGTATGNSNTANCAFTSSGSKSPAVGQTFSFSSTCPVNNGPGGVAYISASQGSLRLWLDANDIDGDGSTSNNPTNGTAISTWYDKSGRSFDLSQNPTGYKPSYYTAGTYNAVKFDAAVNYKHLSASSASYLNKVSAFYVVKAIANGYAANALADDQTYSLRLAQFANTNMVGYTTWFVNDYSTSIAYSNGSYNLYSWHKEQSSTSMTIKAGSSSQTITIGSSAYGVPYYMLGATPGTSVPSDFEALEVIVHDELLNSAKTRIIENYLSSKYGSFSIPNNLYTMDDAVNGNFDYDVSGIGRVDASNIHDDARGTGIVRIYSPSDLGNGEYLLWGHDNALLNANNNTDVPSAVVSRMSRTWRNSHTGNVGTISISFDLTGLGSVTASDLRLLIDTDNDGVFSDETAGTSGVISGATSLGNNIYRFSGVILPNASRFSLGTINRTQTTLPVELLYFTEKCKTNGTDLSWATQTEVNNDYFTIEQSTNNQNWKKITTIKGSGTSYAINEYSYHYPEIRNDAYYRLSQTDYDGKTEIFPMIASSCESDVEEIKVYPTIFDADISMDVENISGDKLNIRLLDLNGHLLLEENVKKETIENNHHINLHIDALSSGSYLLQVSDKDHSVSRKLMKL